jgi:hypothetical protein
METLALLREAIDLHEGGQGRGACLEPPQAPTAPIPRTDRRCVASARSGRRPRRTGAGRPSSHWPRSSGSRW